MSKPVLSVRVNTPLSECVSLMKNHGLSQLPIYSSSRIVGSISDNHIVSILSNSEDPKIALDKPVSGFMEAAFPMVDMKTPLDALYSLFSLCPLCL